MEISRSRAGGVSSPRPLEKSLLPLANVDEVAGNRCRCCHGRRHQMGAALEALTAFEVAVRGRRAALIRLKAVVVHGKAHGAARLAPVKAGLDEDLVETLGLGLCLNQTGA